MKKKVSDTEKVLLTSFVAFFNLTHMMNGYPGFLFKPNSTQFWQANTASTQYILPTFNKGWWAKNLKAEIISHSNPHDNSVNTCGGRTIKGLYQLKKKTFFIIRNINQSFKLTFVEDNAHEL